MTDKETVEVDENGQIIINEDETIEMLKNAEHIFMVTRKSYADILHVVLSAEMPKEEKRRFLLAIRDQVNIKIKENTPCLILTVKGNKVAILIEDADATD